MPLPPCKPQMGAGNTSLQTSIPNQLQLGRQSPHRGRYSLDMEQHRCSDISTKDHSIPITNKHPAFLTAVIPSLRQPSSWYGPLTGNENWIGSLYASGLPSGISSACKIQSVSDLSLRCSACPCPPRLLRYCFERSFVIQGRPYTFNSIITIKPRKLGTWYTETLSTQKNQLSLAIVILTNCLFDVFIGH